MDRKNEVVCCGCGATLQKGPCVVCFREEARHAVREDSKAQEVQP